MIQTNINQHDLNQNSDSEQSDEHHLIILKIRKTEESNFELEAKKQSNPNLFYISLLKGQFHYLHDLSIGMQIGVKGRFDRENKLTIDNSERLLIIVDPHKSIAVTSLGNYIFCPRKKLISEVFISPVQTDKQRQNFSQYI
ncbi:unnamed protein product [Paramecium sonneborni]|uniref:DNA replication factor Dna2 N-terminal domain-containing protein n=1 Tax=Paramecium sonneborni TaxID=65129 RepID=A0A8S1PCU1_9CILI|nr:unnamed protein product [Paramecium sonneborni]